MQRNWLRIILLALTLTTGTGAAIYHFFKWSAPVVIGSAIFSIAIAWFVSETKSKIKNQKLPAQSKFVTIFSLLIAGLAGSGLFYLTRRGVSGWIASPWQIISKYFFLLVGALLILLFIAFIRDRLRPWTLALSAFFLWSVNAFIFKGGYGFDVFVHSATIRAWLTAGSIQPLTFLYNGFHALIALAHTITKIEPVLLMQFGVPLMGALIIATAFKQLRVHSVYQKIAPFFIIGVFILSQPLFTTATPQTLAHFLLLGLIVESLCAQSTRRAAILHFLIAIGIATIHPLSGIVAITFIAWHTRIPKIITGIGAAVLPALALVFSADANFSLPPPAIIQEFFGIQPQSFQPTSIDHLIYLAHLFVPLIGIICIIAAVVHEKKRHNLTLWFGGALLLASGSLLFVALPTVVSYERVDFSRRIFLATWFVVLPVAASGARIIYKNSQRGSRLIISGIIIGLMFSAWYWSYAPHNSIRHSKSINISPLDTKIVRSIDARAAGQPYIVLADQVTSAAALANFGFLERRLPTRDFYFYPIPTGDQLYQKFFLPIMNLGATKTVMAAAADYADVPQVFIVFKPYWEPGAKIIDSLKQNTVNTWSVDGALVGQFVR